MEKPPEHEHVEQVHNFRSNDSADTTSNASDDDFKFTIWTFLAMLAFQMGYFADLIALTGTSGILGVINTEIGPSVSYAWCLTSQIVGAAALSPVVGRLGDIFGRRNVLIVGNIFGVVGCGVAAKATSIRMFIGGGTVLGMANAMHQVSWACLGEIVPKRSRGFAFGFFETSVAVGATFGPVIGWGFVENGSWRPLYWLCFALNATGMIMVFFLYHPINQYIHEEGKTQWEQVLEIDYIGMLLFVFGMVLFIWGISVGGNLYPWRSAGALAPLLIGFALITIMGIYEAKANVLWPIFPPVIFRQIRGVVVLLIGVLIYGILFYGTAVIWPQQVVTLYAKSNMQSGWYSSASGWGGLCTSILYGWLMRRFRRVRWQLVFAMCFLTLVSGVQAIVTPESNVASTALVFLVYSSTAYVSILTAAMVQLNVEHEFIGVATGIMITVRTVGGAIGAAIYVAILENRLIANITKDVAMPLAMAGVEPALLPEIIGALTTGQTTDPAFMALSPANVMLAVSGLKTAYAGAFKIVYLTTIAFGVVGIVVVAFASDVDHLMTKKIEIKLEEGALIHAHMDTGKGHIVKHEIDHGHDVLKEVKV